jgi:hypothetical protein
MILGRSGLPAVICCHPPAHLTATPPTPAWCRSNPAYLLRLLILPLFGSSERGDPRVNGRAVPASSMRDSRT